MRTLDTNSEDLCAFMEQPEAGPVVMINLLRFREQTDSREAGDDVYARYARNAAPMVAAVGGRLLWQGRPTHLIVGEDADRWDKVLMVEYPSRAAFAQMASDPRFQEVQKDRLDALEETVLIACTPHQ
ncbi:MAG: DUF1330 domain-containing protein [Gemmatimonadota bacterium]|nr:MAG: DUF1330 domain-containing protein [Gemmatimonadota bacterium]